MFMVRARPCRAASHADICTESLVTGTTAARQHTGGTSRATAGAQPGTAPPGELHAVTQLRSNTAPRIERRIAPFRKKTFRTRRMGCGGGGGGVVCRRQL